MESWSCQVHHHLHRHQHVIHRLEAVRLTTGSPTLFAETCIRADVGNQVHYYWSAKRSVSGPRHQASPSAAAREILLGAGFPVSIFVGSGSRSITAFIRCWRWAEISRPFNDRPAAVLRRAGKLHLHHRPQQLGGFRGAKGKPINTTVLAVLFEDSVALINVPSPHRLARQLVFLDNPILDGVVSILVGCCSASWRSSSPGSTAKC